MPSQPASSVADLLSQLEAGTMSVDDVAANFSQRTWPANARDTDPTADPVPDPPDSFAEVHGAYMAGRIDEPTYKQLADAAAKGKTKIIKS